MSGRGVLLALLSVLEISPPSLTVFFRSRRLDHSRGNSENRPIDTDMGVNREDFEPPKFSFEFKSANF
jgi:hypothetical protein